MRILPQLKAMAILLLLAFPHFARTQTTLSDKAFITLLTCGPGDELYSVFGHTAIRVADPATGMDVVYNYGSFDFDTPNFYLKFVKGDLQYFVSAGSYQDFIYTYQYYNRDVFEQKLNLTPQQMQQVADDLAKSLISEEKKFYVYKYFDRNCTTMVGDILNKHLPVQISMQNDDLGKTNRKIIIEKLRGKFYENLGISLIFGYKTDVAMYKLFLPVHLMQGVGNTVVNGEPLSEPAVTVYKSTGEAESSFLNNYYTYAVVCLVLMVVSNNILVRRSLFAIFGLLGIFFCFVGLYSYHVEITQNYNALLINPLFLLLLYFSFTNNKRGLQKLAIVLLVLTGLYMLFMVNKPHLFIILPLAALVVIILVREALPVIKRKPRQKLQP